MDFRTPKTTNWPFALRQPNWRRPDPKIPHALCPDCGEPLIAAKTHAEMVAIQTATGAVSATERVFIGYCLIHGRRYVSHMGHHVSMTGKGKKGIQDRYRKCKSILLAKLKGKELKRFKAAWLGRQWVTDEDLAVWDAIALGDEGKS